MRYRMLGRREIHDAFLEAGGNFIDTANVYTSGTSERLLGEFTADHRDRTVLATKYTNATPASDPNAARESSQEHEVGRGKPERLIDV